ncbi:holo-ACP synthase [Porticoccus sp.]|uniref:holo-ACP synthase n=1 Tax=Porticoccus sp. TaxID=2024853 RepID=UPI003F69757C
MIIAIGTDIVQVARISEALNRRGRDFAERILCPRELALFDRKPSPAAYLAKRFAAKEALSKALGTGIGKVSWQDIETVNDSSGAPAFLLMGNAKKQLQKLGANHALLSLSDERDFAVAFVVLTYSHQV